MLIPSSFGGVDVYSTWRQLNELAIPLLVSIPIVSIDKAVTGEIEWKLFRDLGDYNELLSLTHHPVD